MMDLAFYNAGGQAARGPRRIAVVARRVLRRALRPIFLRQVEILQHLIDRLDALDRLTPRVERHEHAVFALRVDSDDLRAKQDELRAKDAEIEARQEVLSEQLQTALAFGWDYVALVRRLATLEDQVAAVSGSYPAATEDRDIHPSILFPGIEKATRKPLADADDDLRSKVC